MTPPRRDVVRSAAATPPDYRDTLTTPRLRLRPLRDDDASAVQAWAGVADNVRYMAWGPNTPEQTRAFVEGAAAGRDFAVVLAATGEVIGSCGIYPDEDGDTAEVGWILHRDHHRQGYGTELARELIRYGFADLRLRRIVAPCAAVNYGSYRVMENAGMRREAVHRKAFWARVDEEWIDELVYAILAEEFAAPSGSVR